MSNPLSLSALATRFGAGASPVDVTAVLYDKIEARGNDPVWISRVPRADALARARALDYTQAPTQPLWGVPFSIKDNIDLAGLPTTAACPAFSYHPKETAFVVQRLIDAGAIPLGKTNLDQFATGLVGVRSPYGIPVNPFNAACIPGGSSSGSAVSVSAGLCSFSLGTDTAGSGRVPASLNGLVGLKPTKGLLSTRGLVPACRTLDCISIFAHTCNDAAAVLRVAAAYDPLDPFSRPAQPPVGYAATQTPRVGIPRPDQLQFFGNADAAKLFAAAVARWRELGATVTEIDFSPFLETARLLYEGPWVAERYASVQSLIETQPEALHPITRRIIEGAAKLSAVDTFKALYRLAELRRVADRTWEQIDFLLTPTLGTPYTVTEVEADPVRLNSNLGYYTNFVNLLDLCGLAVPAGVLPSGVPWGVTLLAPAFHDDRLLAFGARFSGEAGPAPALRRDNSTSAVARVAVCGAHLSGLPLNKQLLERGARLVRATCTAPLYQFYALPGTTPPKPGLVQVGEGGAKIEVEVWELPIEHYGSFVAGIPSPLGIGTLVLEDGENVQGFLCEAWAVRDARNISHYGGWRAFLRDTR
jgi:allophanate hydrolase